jgi:ferredoxin-type protein NapH
MKLTHHITRRISQIFFVFFLNPSFFKNVSICVPVMNCWGCPLAAYACPIGVIGPFLAKGIIPLIAIGTILVVGVLVGRLLCGWVCPFGFLQELLYKIPSVKKHLLPSLLSVKYKILIFTVLIIALLFGTVRTSNLFDPANYYFCNWCPAGTLEATLPFINGRLSEIMTNSFHNPDLMGAGVFDASLVFTALGLLLLLKLFVLYCVIRSAVVYKRPFCRVACPIGAAFAWLNRISLFRVNIDKEKCNACELCQQVCPMDRKIFQETADNECLRCLECRAACQRHAISAG